METTKKLFAKILADNQKTPFSRLNIEKVVNELIAVLELPQEDINRIVEEERAKEIAELEAKKAEAQAVIEEATAKLSVLKAEEIIN